MNSPRRTADEVLSCYEILAHLTQQLLGHAQREEWGAMPAIEEQCGAVVEHLRVLEPAEDMDARQLLRKHSLLSRMRCDYDQVRAAVGPQLEHLREVLRLMQRQRMLGSYDR